MYRVGLQRKESSYPNAKIAIDAKESSIRTWEEVFCLLSSWPISPHHKIKMDAMRLKIRKIRKYAIHTEAWYHYVVGSIVRLRL